MDIIYVCSQKIYRDLLLILVKTEPLETMSKLNKFLTEWDKIEFAESDGFISFKKNLSSTNLIIFGKQRKELFEQIALFSDLNDIPLFNALDTDGLTQKEQVFFKKTKKNKHKLDGLKEAYEKHKANKDAIQMAACLEKAKAIVSGKVKN